MNAIFACHRMRIDQFNWITHNSGEPKWHFSGLDEAVKGKLWALTLPHKMCPRKQTTGPKLLILVSFFSGEVTSYTDTSYCIHIIIVGIIPFRFFLGHPVLLGKRKIYTS